VYLYAEFPAERRRRVDHKDASAADKPGTVRRERIGGQVGHFNDGDISRLPIALAFVMGLADQLLIHGQCIGLSP
jgi:hypothetical protein